jgi:hypothetical protein
MEGITGQCHSGDGVINNNRITRGSYGFGFQKYHERYL